MYSPGCFYPVYVVSARDVGSPGALLEELRHAAGAYRDLAFWLQHDRRGSVRRDAILLQVLEKPTPAYCTREECFALGEECIRLGRELSPAVIDLKYMRERLISSFLAFPD